ncbi:hypothetical protein ACO2Q0_02915 [Phenylobacterium sp. VNQ135]|uniref:hypothetical protein n=1 Tax=Phenylobacterium sp. VNQ135 TaxID=3400922 RepID=UPI003C0483EA
MTSQDIQGLIEPAPTPGGIDFSNWTYNTLPERTGNVGWRPDLQDLIYTAINAVEGDYEDADDNAAEQVIERLVLAVKSLLGDLDTLKRENEELRLAICGGEDAPGYAASLPHKTVVSLAADNYRDLRHASDSALAAEARVKELEKALNGLWPANLLRVPDHLPDDSVFPVDVTAGELRRAAEALSQGEEGSRSSRGSGSDLCAAGALPGLTASAVSPKWWQVADSETVWRVCHARRKAHGKACERCPSSELADGESFTRGCYLQAVETVNIVQTGNPWRKTEGVKAPWVVYPSPIASELVIADLQALAAAARLMLDDHQTSETHHPDHVLVPLAAFEAMREAFCSPSYADLTAESAGERLAAGTGTAEPVSSPGTPPPHQPSAEGAVSPWRPIETASEHDVAYKALGIALAALQHIQGMEPITQEITLPTVMAQHAVDALKEIEALGATSCPNPCGECRGVVRAGKCGVCGWEPVP